jgi:hypothetical protein
MKKTNTSNPLKFFNDNKDKVYKKAGGEMTAFKKSLTKAQDGRITGPMTQQEAAAETAATSYPGPYATSTNSFLPEDFKNMSPIFPKAPGPKNEMKPIYGIDPKAKYMLTSLDEQKKGGSVKKIVKKK